MTLSARVAQRRALRGREAVVVEIFGHQNGQSDGDEPKLRVLEQANLRHIQRYPETCVGCQHGQPGARGRAVHVGHAAVERAHQEPQHRRAADDGQRGGRIGGKPEARHWQQRQQ